MDRVAKILISVASAILLIAPIAYFENSANHPPTTNLNPLIVGPRIQISTDSGLNNNTTVTLEISVIAPHLMGNQGNFMNHYTTNASILLLNTTLTNATQSFFLPGEFYSLADSWVALYKGQPAASFPSLQISAFKTADTNGTVSVYKYYNNLPYNPYSIKEMKTENLTIMNEVVNQTNVNIAGITSLTFANSNLSAKISFSKKPLQTIRLQNNSVASQAVEPSTQTTSYYYTTSYKTYDTAQYVNTVYGSLPLMAVHLSNAVANGKSMLTFGAYIGFLSDTINMNSVNVYNSSAGEVSSVMSTSPSYAHDANISETSYLSTFGAYPLNIFPSRGNLSVRQNETTAYVGIGNVTYTFSHYNQYTDKYSNKYERICNIYPNGAENCHNVFISSTRVAHTYDGNGTIGAISAINTNNGDLTMVADYLPVFVNAVLHKTINASNGTVYMSASTPGNVVQAFTIWAETYGYSNANSVISTTANVLSTFSSAISLGLAIADALAAGGIIGEPGEIADTIGLIGDTIGMDATILGLFSSISFISGTKAATVSYSASDAIGIEPGSNYTARFYESYSPVTFNENGNSYSFYAPLNYLNVTGMS